MLVIVASRHDRRALELATGWASSNARLLSCEDLSKPGWRYYPGNPEGSVAVVDGQTVPVIDFRGVLTLRPAILREELGHIAAADRDYVAAEMNAFLIAFLSSLRCRILNRPTPLSLSGPNWRAEQWTRSASALGIPVRPVKRHIPWDGVASADTQTKKSVEVTVAGAHCFGDVAKPLARQAQQLARAAKAELLSVWFSGPEPGSQFLGVNLWPDLRRADVAAAVQDHLLAKG